MNNDFHNAAHANLLRPIINTLRKRTGSTSFEWVKGHSNITGNEEADKLATLGASKNNSRKTLFITSPELNHNGAKLCSLTQATAYCLILRTHPPPNLKNSTSSNLDLIKEATSDLDGTRPTNERIWSAAIKNRRDLSIGVRSFLWKLIHNAHKCGHYWSNIPNHEERGICHNCGSTESMQHILFNCDANKCDHAWNTVKALCAQKNINWPSGFNITSIMVLPLTIKTPNNAPRPGATCFFLIATSECTFMLWKIRCKDS